jgi:hypothetical protein
MLGKAQGERESLVEDSAVPRRGCGFYPPRASSVGPSIPHSFRIRHFGR